ncbi:MAG: putative metal-binding motif-containing protein, partial [Myxococcota bacterium]|nr:putative metal-binding motif-containing protein [Myxococcota bacterium]
MPNQHSLVPIILCTLASCTWISDARLTEKSQILDRDNDGIPFKEDCNDEDETIYPGATEIFYDGIDQNCDRANDFDQDGDGRVPTEFVDSTTTTGNEELPNLLPGGDCWDLPDPPTGVEGSATVQSVDINSGAADDPPYDGIDQNCDGKDDFDVDGDGYVGDEYAGIETIIGHDTDGNALTTGGDLPSGDCNDLNNAINIDQPESWYNGIDENCDGLDDYDADFDGYVSNDYAEFSELPSGDCDDTDETIHPDAIESYYDGVDQNCDGLDDYDADLDGFTPSQYASLSTLPSEDCDDADPEVYPEAIEILNDERDLDCDGTADSMALFDIEWTNFDVLSTTPIRVEQLTASANDDAVYVAFLEDVSSTSNGGANPLAIGFNFTTREIDTYFNWATIPSQYTDGISITVRDTDFFGAFGEYNSQDRWLHLTARNLDSGTITHRRSFVN